MLRNTAAVFLALSWCSTAFAQAGTTSKLHIYLRDPKCADVTEVTAIIQDRDREITKAKRQPDDRCHWLVDLTPDRFRTDRTHFSLRLSGIRARTTCRIAAWDGTIATSKFIVLSTVRQVIITPSPGDMNLQYVREVAPIEREDVACFESGKLGTGSEPWTIDAVSTKDEKLRLQHFESARDECGLILNSAHGEYSAARIEHELARQRNEGVVCARPYLSGAAMDITRKNLQQSQLKTLTIEWKP